MFLASCRDKLIDILNNHEEVSKKILDIIFCKIDLDKKIMNYSGINVPIFVVKNDKLVELKSDNSADGFILNDFKLTNHKVQLAKGDTLYILNDGFSDSNSGVIEKSYISDEISSLFMKVYKKEMGKQKTLFEKTFESWRKELKQLKDILALGIKL